METTAAAETHTSRSRETTPDDIDQSERLQTLEIPTVGNKIIFSLG